MKLVGVDGSCLQVQGLVTVEFTMSGIFSQELIVANTLTSEGILGLNFLEANECVLDLHQGEMCSCGAKICLHAKGLQGQTTAQVNIVLPENFTIAATSGTPIWQGVRRLPLPKRDEVKKLLSKMQQKEIITPSKSPWASSIVLYSTKERWICTFWC